MVSGEGSQPFKFGGVWRDLEVSGERVGVVSGEVLVLVSGEAWMVSGEGRV